MGRRDRERRERIGAGLEKPIATPTDPQEKARRGLCPFPGCQGTPLRAVGAHGFCAKHESFLADLIFILPHIEWRQPETKGGLVLPGQPGFSVLPKNTA